MTIEWGKLGLLGLALVGCFITIALKSASFVEVLPVITGILGYIYGNGRLASKGQTPVPMIGPSDQS